MDFREQRFPYLPIQVQQDFVVPLGAHRSRCVVRIPNTQEKLEADVMHHVLWSEIHGTPGYEATVSDFADVVR